MLNDGPRVRLRKYNPCYRRCFNVVSNALGNVEPRVLDLSTYVGKNGVGHSHPLCVDLKHTFSP